MVQRRDPRITTFVPVSILASGISRHSSYFLPAPERLPDHCGREPYAAVFDAQESLVDRSSEPIIKASNRAHLSSFNLHEFH